jgi:hypothetical protein
MTSKDVRTTTGSDNVVIGNNSNLPVPFGPLDIDRTTPTLASLGSRLNWKAGARAPKDKEASERENVAVLLTYGSDFPLAK